MRRVLQLTGFVIAVLAVSAPALAQPENGLFPVHFTLYLTEESPLYPYAVNHPCGKIVTLRADTIPVRLPDVRPVWAYELASDGKIETTWAMPIDSTPLAVAGDRLMIHQLDAEDIVFVTTSFDIGRALENPDRAILNEENEHRIQCPAGAEAQELTRWHLCSELLDGSTGETRIIAYPPVCT